MAKKICVKNRVRRTDEFQFYMHQFVEACVRGGFASRRDVLPSYKWHFRSLCRRVLIALYRCVKRLMPWMLKRDKALVITANGGTMPDNIFPYYFGYEIVPVLWDVWPSTWERMYAAFRRYDVRVVFVTARQVADMINRETSVRAFWMPEGIESTAYNRGGKLVDRQQDIFEMGRKMARYHEAIKDVDAHFVATWTKTDGTLDQRKLTFTNEELHTVMQDVKVMVCFPQCDTNPGRAGRVDTLTQRYWEAMLSGCVMVGRAPQELIDVVGYNPVVDVDWSDPKGQMEHLLAHIDEQQPLVDRNYRAAHAHADWSARMDFLKTTLTKEGYEI